ncbi:WD repeat-containing protein 54 [Camelus dromedarius]|uniref:WD repeat-containing protein 54 n=1 Tax=Camelus dromedarius TaxID=9838 RepID=A0A5N4D8H4_CAMDR|nr:WD repeat-containing protein 54 [Camelus dromedarius]
MVAAVSERHASKDRKPIWGGWWELLAGLGSSGSRAEGVQAVFARGIAASGHFISVGEGAEDRALSVVMPVPGVLTSQPGSPHLLSEELLDSRAHQSQTLPPSPPRPGYGFAYLSRADTGRADPGLSPHDCVADTVKTDDMHLHVSGRSGLIQIPAEFQESGNTFVHIWKLSRSPESGYIEVEHCHGACVPDTQVCGARFCDPSGSSFAVTGYDLAEILRFSSMRESSSPPSPLWYYL